MAGGQDTQIVVKSNIASSPMCLFKKLGFYCGGVLITLTCALALTCVVLKNGSGFVSKNDVAGKTI